jgi:hypothetical protein
MKLHQMPLCAVCLMLFVFNAPASVRYVDLNSANPTPPYADWSTAATNIQDAVVVAQAGDFVVVTNGIYNFGGTVVYGQETNRVVLTNAITLTSVNGAQSTTIVGGNSTRCAYVGSNSVLMGFTLTSGRARNSGNTNESNGGGAWCVTGGVISNCVIVGNFSGYSPIGGLGGGVFGGTIFNSTLTNNNAYYGGGAAQAVLFNCTIVTNGWLSPSGGDGGGLYQGTASNCTLAANYSNTGAAGATLSTLFNCSVSGNKSDMGVAGVTQSTLFNCVVNGNISPLATGVARGCLFYNSTVISNYGGSYASRLCTNYNSIFYYNTGLNYASTFNYCCTVPLPPGIGNITNLPGFVNLAGDLHLQSNSSCINAGNNAYVTITNDLDGNPRIVGGTVDIGAYEYQTPSSIFSYAWAQKYGLRTDGSADFLDSDGDGLNNWQEWKTGTIPTNAASVLKLASPSNSVSGVTVTWQSVTNVTYYLQSSTNLSAQSAFTCLQSNIVGQAGSTSYTDTTATNGGPYFYRVGVQ